MFDTPSTVQVKEMEMLNQPSSFIKECVFRCEKKLKKKKTRKTRLPYLTTCSEESESGDVAPILGSKNSSQRNQQFSPRVCELIM